MSSEPQHPRQICPAHSPFYLSRRCGTEDELGPSLRTRFSLHTVNISTSRALNRHPLRQLTRALDTYPTSTTEWIWPRRICTGTRRENAVDACPSGRPGSASGDGFAADGLGLTNLS